MEQFKATMAKIAEHESNNAHRSTVELNEFSDWTEAEYESILTHKPMTEEAYEENLKILPLTDNEEGIDWRLEGKVQEIKNQRSCGSCWAFSSVSALESAHAIAHDELPSLSEQQLVDCSTRNSGCNGGLQEYAFDYYKKNFAIDERM